MYRKLILTVSLMASIVIAAISFMFLKSVSDKSFNESSEPIVKEEIQIPTGKAKIEEPLPIVSDDIGKNEIIEYEVKKGDSLYAIALKFNTTVARIKTTNSLKGDLILSGQKLKIDTSIFSILIEKSENRLTILQNNVPFKTYTVATGKDNKTPVGEFSITDKMVKPPWTNAEGEVIMADDERYELGERWIALSVHGYGIHGTKDPGTIGDYVTSGCIRMFNKDVIELYDIIPRGTVVVIKN